MIPRERAFYLAHASLAAFWRKVHLAQSVIEAGLSKMIHPYISMSFGKDSTVMTHLVLSIIPNIPVIYVNCGEFDEWPDTPRVRDEFLRRFPCDFHETTGPSIIGAYEAVGHVYTQDCEETSAAKRAQREYGKSLEIAIVAKARELGCDGGFLGMRAEESFNRSRLFGMRSNLYHVDERQMWTCCPLERWTGRDVWAYLVFHDLPYNELYDLHPMGREKARNGAMTGTRLSTMGRMSWLKRMYPDWWNRLMQRFPEIAREL
jgi:3'-phosphoadenosine 5'-phosphosulfate sulfotransferase (PAPS reductase)/FAD synthetase